MKKPLLLLLILLLAGGVVFGLTRLGAESYMASKDKCAGSHATHVVQIKDSHVMPAKVNGQFCDKLEIINLDSQSREMAFGRHEQHVAYDGVTERLLAQNQSLTVTLNQKGDFIFHDHFQDEVGGSFSVR